jgi:hypothetical protein
MKQGNPAMSAGIGVFDLSSPAPARWQAITGGERCFLQIFSMANLKLIIGNNISIRQLSVCLDMRFAYGWHHKSKVGLWTQGTYTALQHHQLLKETI